MKRIIYSITCLLAFVVSHAQDKNSVQEVSGLRADGKIWVVMAVCLTILTGLVIYVISLDRKISKKEKM